MTTWVKKSGRLAEIAAQIGGGIYAESDDGRFILWVRRYKRPQGYLYMYSATDYNTPSSEGKFTTVPQRDVEGSSAKKVMKAVDRWVADHPSPGQQGECK